MGPDTATGRMNPQAWGLQQPPAAGGGRRIPAWGMGRGHSPQTPWSWTLTSARREVVSGSSLGDAHLRQLQGTTGRATGRGQSEPCRSCGELRGCGHLQRRPDLGQEGCMGWRVTGPTDRQSTGWTEVGSHCRDNGDAVSSMGRPTRSSALK